MRILVTGAYGFIGAQVISTLQSAGHDIIPCVHDIDQAKRRFPQLAHQAIPCNFVKDTDAGIWLPRLTEIDAVVNCVGILHSRNPSVIEAVHYKTPKALVEACIDKKIQKFVHLSAMGADENVDTPYARTKYEFEKYLLPLDYNWVIFRPSLVYGPGSYGGTSLFRALAALPWVVPVLGDGKQMFQPIHIRELAQAMQIAVEDPKITKSRINAVGSKPISVEEITLLLRSWLGFDKGRILHIPISLMRPLAFLGNFFNDMPINTTSLKMLSYNYTDDVKPFEKLFGFKPKSMEQNLMESPSSTQDRWHARLYFVNPLLRLTLSIFWIFSGLIPLLFYQDEEILEALAYIGIEGYWAQIIFYSSCTANILLGLATLANYKIKWVGLLQILLIVGYTLGVSIFMPAYWLDPMGSLLKNIPLLAATLAMMAMADPR